MFLNRSSAPSPCMLYITNGPIRYRQSSRQTKTALTSGSSRFCKMILRMCSRQNPAASTAQNSVVIIWLQKMQDALSASPFQRRASPQTTSYRFTRNSGRKTMASASPNAMRVKTLTTR